MIQNEHLKQAVTDYQHCPELFLKDLITTIEQFERCNSNWPTITYGITLLGDVLFPGTFLCPNCNGLITGRTVFGTKWEGAEGEAPWEECEDCGYVPGSELPETEAAMMSQADEHGADCEYVDTRE